MPSQGLEGDSTIVIYRTAAWFIVRARCSGEIQTLTDFTGSFASLVDCSFMAYWRSSQEIRNVLFNTRSVHPTHLELNTCKIRRMVRAKVDSVGASAHAHGWATT